jgi:hypothetical protein
MSAAGSRVTPLRRPPVRQSVVVRSDRSHTFGMFVATIGAWWPVTPFSAGRILGHLAATIGEQE